MVDEMCRKVLDLSVLPWGANAVEIKQKTKALSALCLVKQENVWFKELNRNHFKHILKNKKDRDVDDPGALVYQNSWNMQPGYIYGVGVFTSGVVNSLR
jgi:hypothetical protein